MNRKELKTALYECHFIEYPKDIKNEIQKGETINHCYNCNVNLEKSEYVGRTFTRVGRGHIYEEYCPFCYSKI